MTDGSNKFIRNSMAVFLIFTHQAGEQRIEARNESRNVLPTRKRWKLE